MIVDLYKKQNYTQESFSKAIGMTKNGFIKMINNKSMKTDVLEKISKILGVSIIKFFEESPTTYLSEPEINYNGNEIDKLQKRLIELYSENKQLMLENSNLKEIIAKCCHGNQQQKTKQAH